MGTQGLFQAGETFYEKILRGLIFKAFPDPERAHKVVLGLLRGVGALGLKRSFFKEDKGLEQEVFGLKFPNPVGLAAGFDKNGVAIVGLSALGFGFLEIGTVTRWAQEGNPRPRMFRFPKDEAAINRMGFNNDGADRLAVRLARVKMDRPLGINLGKSKITPLDEAVDDYLYSLRKAYPFGDFFGVNVSSPNTPGLRRLQERDYLYALLMALQEESKTLSVRLGIKRKPILVKVSSDLAWGAMDELLEVCVLCEVAGVIAVNTTITRDGLSVPTTEAGGLSGKPLWPKAISVVRYISHQTKGKLPIIGVGGIFGSDEANQMLGAGASLIQVFTGLVYKGPFIVHQINRGLRKLMDQEGMAKLSDFHV